MRDGLARYREDLATRRTQARKSMLRALDTTQYRGFVDRMRRCLEAGPPRASSAPRANEPFVHVAPDLVTKQMAKLLKRGRRLERSSPDEAFHALRIHCKRMRYLCEFFADVYGKPARKFAKRVKKLQNILGRHQDLVVAQRMLRDFAWSARAPRSELRSLYLALGKHMADQSRRVQEVRRAFFPAWRKFDRKSVRKPLTQRLHPTAISSPPRCR
jgi:CHAD domain-containing protein